MKKKKIVIFALTAMSAMALSTSLACNTDSHTHDYTALKSNGTHHWYECSCGEKSGYEKHVDLVTDDNDLTPDGKCDKCGHAIDDTEVKYFTVTFDMGGHGTAPDALTVKDGKTATAPADPTDEHYDFLGWFASPDDETPFDFENAAITDDTTLYAKWDAKSYTVTFHLNGHGGETAPDTQTVKYGDKSTVPSEPSDSECIFLGWFADVNGDVSFDFNTAISGNTNLYAKWEVIPEDKVSVVFNYGGHGGNNYLEVIDEGATVTKPADPTEEHYNFLGWFTTADGDTEFDFDASISENTTVYAKWEVKTYTVTFDMGGHGTAPDAQPVKYGNKATEPADPTDQDYNFLGWFTTADGDTEFDFDTTISGDTTLYAKWDEKQTFTVTFNTDKYYGVTAPAAQSVKEGNKATKPATPVLTGFKFINWFTDSECKNDFNFNKAITGNTTLYAKFIPNKLPLSDDLELAGNTYTIVCANGEQRWSTDTGFLVELVDFDDSGDVEFYTVQFNRDTYTLEIDGFGDDVIVKIYDSKHETLKDTLKKKVLVYPDLEVGSTTVTNAADNVKGGMAYYRVQADGTYTFEADNRYSIYIYTNYEEDKIKYITVDQGKTVEFKLKEGALFAISFVEYGASFNVTFTLTEKEVPPPIGGDEPDGTRDNPFKIESEGSQVVKDLTTDVNGDYFVVFTATEAGTYHISCTGKEWGKTVYYVSFTVNGVQNGYVVDPNVYNYGYMYRDGEQVCEKYEDDYKAAPYATVTLAAGESVTIIMNRKGQYGALNDVTCTVEKA